MGNRDTQAPLLRPVTEGVAKTCMVFAAEREMELPWQSRDWDSDSKAGGMGSIPCRGTRIPHAVWHGQKKGREKWPTMVTLSP